MKLDNPHSMQLPTAADLVRAFIADLSNVLDVGQSTSSRTIQRTLWTSSSTATLTADRDYDIVAVYGLQAGQFVLATIPITTAQVGLANGSTYDVVVAFTSTTGLANFPTMRWRWSEGTKIYLVSTAGVGVLLVLEP